MNEEEKEAQERAEKRRQFERELAKLEKEDAEEPYGDSDSDDYDRKVRN
jgi:hypothetical protein